ncbi:hypothetical protein LUZ60_008603 [Juncus effusus]|nr:hypothetical protein LUZ60_008603 [Juncus effusus]
MPKKNKPVDLSVVQYEQPSDDYHQYNMYDHSRAPVLIVHVGDHMIEATATSEESVVAKWIRNSLNDTRQLNRRRSGPLIISLCAFRGLTQDPMSWRVRDRLKGPKANPNHPDNPYKVISMCIAGCRVLFYREDSYYGNGVPNIRALRNLLEDKKVVVVGLGIKEIAKKLESQWGLRIATPVDIRKVAAIAYGKNAVYWPMTKKGRVVIDQLSLEELGELVLDGLVLEKKPAKILENDWADSGYGSNIEMEEQRVMYASRDAFLCYEIGAKCIETTGLPSDN